jgi:hypothetical protein
LNQLEEHNMEDKTHYRKAFNSPYLSSQDVTEPTVLTIRCARLERDHTKRTKDMFNTAYFVEGEIRPGEKLKPMILNATNSKTIADITGSKFLEDWNDVPVLVYVDQNVRFGNDQVEGLRLRAVDRRELERAKQIKAEAEEAAKQGTQAFRLWWKAADKDARATITTTDMAALQKAAADADRKVPANTNTEGVQA